MNNPESINGKILLDTEDGAIYLGYDSKTKELYAGYVAGNAAISRNWTIPYDRDASLDSQLQELASIVSETVNG